ncbi:hypothetical protein HXX76_014752, partial [Chlamydomonas incerta]
MVRAGVAEPQVPPQAAFASIHENPGAALEPVPVAKLPTVFMAASTAGEDAADSAAADQRQVLGRRKGRTLTKRTILKSYLLPRSHKQQLQNKAENDAEVPPHVQRALPRVQRNVSSTELGALLNHLGAGPDGRSHVVIADVREELVVYVNGVPYIRRELEMPAAAAMHHAGVHAAQLQELEVLLKDVT